MHGNSSTFNKHTIMSLFDFFRAPAPATPAAPPTPAAPAAPGAVTPPAPATPEPTPPADPLASLVSIWQTPTGADGKPLQIANPLDALQQAPLTADPTKVRDAVGKLDFAQGISPETITKIQTGTPEEATANLAGLINAAVRQAVTGITLSQTELVNQALAKQRDAFTAALPTMLKRQQLLDSRSDDPVLSHPAVQPLITALKQTVFNKNPTANPADVDKQVTDYLRGLSAAMSTDPDKARKQATANATQDWDSWLDGQ